MKAACNIAKGQIKNHMLFGEMGTYPFGLSHERASQRATCQHCHFGRLVATRAYSSGAYRYACLPVTCLPIGKRQGFNGKEKDGETNCYDYGFRIYNPGLARFLSVDPLFGSYPWYTPYQFAGNLPIAAKDVDGLEECLANIYVINDVEIMWSISWLYVSDRVLDQDASCGQIFMIKRTNFVSYYHEPSSVKDFWDKSSKSTKPGAMLGCVNNQPLPIQEAFEKCQNGSYERTIELSNGGTKSEKFRTEIFHFSAESALIKFDTDVSSVENAKKNMSEEAKRAMEKFAILLAECPELGLNIEGFADAQGLYDKNGNKLSGTALESALKHNLELSKNRDEALKSYVDDFLTLKGYSRAVIDQVLGRITATGKGTIESETDKSTLGKNSENRMAKAELRSSDNSVLTLEIKQKVYEKMGYKKTADPTLKK